ncbi:hypothetical protein [Paraburkholderia domus]|uniref:Uncharacterized protein n=1 Tax=Paraburkholderia domus TaxID=2793075 RepID=A0A9N8N6R0_9BURK|nr:hypothetical protein [Paraburkholderia domus]MBK5169468.1 hypothetical protein [Burkholderia sp. R-70211]CAE6959390.1 hypothetical protein R70211_06826 [Paraburkholderia domus]
MSQADRYHYEIDRERRRDLVFQRMRDTTRPFLERYRVLLDDVSRAGLNEFAEDEFRELSARLRALETRLEIDPPGARDESRALAPRFHGLPRLARQLRQLQREAEQETIEANRAAQLEESRRSVQIREDIEKVWQEEVVGWNSPVAARSAFRELQALRERLLNGQSTASADEVATAIREVRARHEAVAAREHAELASRACDDALADILSLRRAQLEPPAAQADARAAKLREALAAATGLDSRAQIERLDALAAEEDEVELDESQRREVVRAVYQSLTAAGFVTDMPVRRGGSEGKEGDEVLIRARRPAGPQAEFRIDLRGELTYKFHQYRGAACQQDIAPVMVRLQDAYGISLSDRRVLWVNPDDTDRDARPQPDNTQENSS